MFHGYKVQNSYNFLFRNKNSTTGAKKKKKNLHFAPFCDAVNSTSGVYSLLFLVLTEPE